MKKLFALILALAMVFALAACGDKTTNEQGTTGGQTQTDTTTPPATTGGGKLTFTTGGDQGTYYGFGTVLAGKVSDKTSTSVTAITSGGSKANIETMAAGDAQLGFVQSDVGAYAYQGTRLFDAPDTSFSTVAALYMEQVQIVTLDPDIKSVADLKGKSVSIGAAGSGVYFNAVDVLGAYGIDADKDINPTYQSFGDSVESLQDGKIDAAFVVAGAPTTAVTSLAATKQVYLVSLDDEHIDKLIALAKGVRKTGGNTMDFEAFDTQKMDEYREEARKSWGDTPAWQEYERKRQGRGSDQERQLGDGLMDVLRQFHGLLGKPADSPEAAAAVQAVQAYITQHFYTCTPAILRGLGQMYGAGGDMTASIDAACGAGTAEYAAKAIEAYTAQAEG